MRSVAQLVEDRRRFRRSVLELLESLGSSPTTVANNLIALHVAGRPRNSCDGPVARYLSAIVGSEPSVKGISVTERRARISRAGKCARLGTPVRVGLPEPIITFVRAFNSGCYPELIEPAADTVSGDAGHATRQPYDQDAQHNPT